MAPSELAELDVKYDILRLNVISSNTITGRTAALVKHLDQSSVGDKRSIASLRARATVANKLISVVEIAKRELLQNKQKVYQYSSITSENINLKSSQKDATNKQPGGDNVAEDAVDDEEVAFEVMKPKDKIRDVPVLTVYLSMAPVKELQDLYG